MRHHGFTCQAFEEVMSKCLRSDESLSTYIIEFVVVDDSFSFDSLLFCLVGVGERHARVSGVNNLKHPSQTVDIHP